LMVDYWFEPLSRSLNGRCHNNQF